MRITHATSGSLSASAKSLRCARLVVPTDTISAPAAAITSGMRYEPPISTNSERATTTLRPLPSAAATSNTVAALLLTGRPASAPVNCANKSQTAPSRLPRPPVSASISHIAAALADAAASCASSGHCARPRLVCKTTPVALITLHI